MVRKNPFRHPFVHPSATKLRLPSKHLHFLTREEFGRKKPVTKDGS